MPDPRPLICDIARLMYDRKLTDSAGGNISVRQGDRIYVTPRYAGSRHRWQLEPRHIVVTDLGGSQLEGEGAASREFRMHLAIYEAFPAAGAVCHAHALNAMVFASARMPIPPTSEQTEKFGTVELSDEVPAHSEALARSVVETLSRKREGLDKHAIACLMPRHGITVVGPTLDDAFDALERLDGSCYILIARAALGIGAT